MPVTAGSLAVANHDDGGGEDMDTGAEDDRAAAPHDGGFDEAEAARSVGIADLPDMVMQGDANTACDAETGPTDVQPCFTTRQWCSASLASAPALHFTSCVDNLPCA